MSFAMFNSNNAWFRGDNEDTIQFIAELRAEGYATRPDRFNNVMGLLISTDRQPAPQGDIPPCHPADFFAFSELNRNLDLIQKRDFASIKARRPTDWTIAAEGKF